MFLHSKNISLSQWSKCSCGKISILINLTLLSMNYPWNLAPAQQTPSAHLKADSHQVQPIGPSWYSLATLQCFSCGNSCKILPLPCLLWRKVQPCVIDHPEIKKNQFNYFALNVYLLSFVQPTYHSKIKNVVLKTYHFWKSFLLFSYNYI